MIEIGRSLPNLTDPTSTTGAALALALNGVFLVSGATMPGRSRGINPLGRFCGFEYQGCPKGEFGRDYKPAVIATRLAIGCNFALAVQRLDGCDIRDREAQGIQRHPRAVRRNRNAATIAERHGFHDLDVAVFSHRLDAQRIRMQIAQAGKAFKENMM